MIMMISFPAVDCLLLSFAQVSQHKLLLLIRLLLQFTVCYPTLLVVSPNIVCRNTLAKQHRVLLSMADEIAKGDANSIIFDTKFVTM